MNQPLLGIEKQKMHAFITIIHIDRENVNRIPWINHRNHEEPMTSEAHILNAR